MATNNHDFVFFVRQKAEEKRKTAGYNGSWDDGGAGNLENIADAFECGLSGMIPNCLKSLHKEFLRTQDPEYQKYLDLKRKFE